MKSSWAHPNWHYIIALKYAQSTIGTVHDFGRVFTYINKNGSIVYNVDARNEANVSIGTLANYFSTGGL